MKFPCEEKTMKSPKSIIQSCVVTVLVLCAIACGPGPMEDTEGEPVLSQVGPIGSIQQFASGCTLFGGVPTYNSDTGKIRTAAMIVCGVQALELTAKTQLTRNGWYVAREEKDCHFAKSCLVELYVPNIQGNQEWCNLASGIHIQTNNTEYYKNPPRCETAGF
jgi:hypothetical protein